MLIYLANSNLRLELATSFLFCFVTLLYPAALLLFLGWGREDYFGLLLLCWIGRLGVGYEGMNYYDVGGRQLLFLYAYGY